MQDIEDIEEKYQNEDEANKQKMNESKNPLNDTCIKVKIVKKPRCDITKLRCGEPALSNCSGSAGENDRMNEKSEWDTMSCDAGTDVAHFARTRCVDDVMYHVVKKQGS